MSKDIPTHNAFGLLRDIAEDEQSTEMPLTPTHPHVQPHSQTAADMSHQSLASSTLTAEQLDADHDSMLAELQQLQLTQKHQRNALVRAQIDAIKQAESTASLLLHQSPMTAIRHPSLPVNRSLFIPPIHAQVLSTPVPAIAQARRDAIAALPSAIPPMNISSSSSVPVPVPTSVSAAPASSTTRHLRHTPPEKFRGDNSDQSARVETWIQEAQIYLDASGVAPERQLLEITALLTGSALEWYKVKQEEVDDQNKVMTWPYLQERLIEEFGRSRGQLAERLEWAALKMGTKNADGTETGGKATRTVRDYTSLFTRLMRTLTGESRISTSIVLIDRYCDGIKTGYPALWTEMKGVHAALVYATLADAIVGAELAETALSLRSKDSSHHRSRHHAYVNHLSSNRMDDSPSPPRSPVHRRRQKKQSTLVANGFVYRPSTSDEGRYPLSESQQKALYDQNRCYRCYQPRHPKMNSCPKKMTSAPSDLN